MNFFQAFFCAFIIIVNRAQSNSAEADYYNEDITEKFDTPELNDDDNDLPTTTNAPQKFSEKSILDSILKNYDAFSRPENNPSEPVTVSTNMYLRNLARFDQNNMEFRTQFTFRQEWIDKRLGYGLAMSRNDQYPSFLMLHQNQSIWRPDTFFQNDIESKRHMIDKPNVLFRIYPDGKILYSQRLTVTFFSPMSFERFPFDSQVCMIDFASYSYTTSDIIYKWKGDNPIQTKHGLFQSLPQFSITNISDSYCTSKTATGEYSCLRVTINLKRSKFYFMMHIFIPMFLLVVSSWLPFLFTTNNLSAQLSFGSVMFISSMIVPNMSKFDFPEISYISALVVWIFTCCFFTLLSMIRSLLLAVYEVQDNNKMKTASLETPNPGDRRQQNQIGHISKIVLPLSYFGFCLIYYYSYAA